VIPINFGVWVNENWVFGVKTACSRNVVSHRSPRRVTGRHGEVAQFIARHGGEYFAWRSCPVGKS